MNTTVEQSVVRSRILSGHGCRSLHISSPYRNYLMSRWNLGSRLAAHQGEEMHSWVVLLVKEGRPKEFAGPGDPQLAQFLRLFAQKCSSGGINITPRPQQILETPLLPPSSLDPAPHRIEAMSKIRDTLTQNMGSERPSIVIVLRSAADSYIYQGMKRLGDVELGLKMVDIVFSSIRIYPTKQEEYFSNVTLKIKIQLGGVNELFSSNSQKFLKKDSTMLVGIDIARPSAESSAGTPCVVAVVASIDDKFEQFPVSLKLQKDTLKESDLEGDMIQGLTEAICERLELYEKINSRLPNRIIVYRDGVSEDQYRLVSEIEIPRILEAFSMFGNYRPKLSVVICCARFNVRFFPRESPSEKDNTIRDSIDQDTTDNYSRDFYLSDAMTLESRGHATHFTIVHDENEMSRESAADTSAQPYGTTMEAVGLASPAYHADLACECARLYLNPALNIQDKKPTQSSRSWRRIEKSKEQVFEEAVKYWGRGVHPNLRESMFYI